VFFSFGTLRIDDEIYTMVKRAAKGSLDAYYRYRIRRI